MLSICTDSGEPNLSVGQSMAITILPSDNAFGRFSFSQDSLSFVVSEQTGGTAVIFTVVRAGGRFDTVTVCWLVSQSGTQGPTSDLEPSSGQLEFAEQQSQQQFTITVNDDRVSGLWIALCIISYSRDECRNDSETEKARGEVAVMFITFLLFFVFTTTEVAREGQKLTTSQVRFPVTNSFTSLQRDVVTYATSSLCQGRVHTPYVLGEIFSFHLQLVGLNSRPGG